MEQIIGRNSEYVIFDTYTHSGKSEFIALYGRRRIGKTFLVKKYFGERFDFYTTGVIGGKKSEQMAAFYTSLKASGYKGAKPKNWMEAFGILGTLLDTQTHNGRLVVFIDEMPCFDTQHSDFINAVDFFWNSKGSTMDNLFFIVCGSATSWMINNIVNNKGGLHNRITHELHLKPFDLYQTELYAKSRNSNWSRLSIMQLYAAIGGVPYYLSLVDFNKSVTENIDYLFFSEDAPLSTEYKRLFGSLFKSPENYLSIIKALTDNKSGLTRKQIAEKLKLPNNGHLSDMLENLVQCDFIRRYNNGLNTSKGIYQLIDFYTLFYNQFCIKRTTDTHFWSNHLNQPMMNTWFGLGYERICAYHIKQVLYAMRVDRIAHEYYSWRSKKSNPAVQIDIIIDRADNVINIAEVKYSQAEYTLNAEEYSKIMYRLETFTKESKTKKGVQPMLITTFGVRPNGFSGISNTTVTLDDLFQPLI